MPVGPPNPSAASPSSSARTTLAVLFVGVLLGALDIAIVGPALPALQQAFSVDSRALAWVFNIYVLVGLVAAPLLAKASDRHGRRAVYVAAVLTFGLGSLAVASAPSFAWLLVGRAVQALGAGGLLPVASAVVADTVPRERRGRALGLIGAVFGIAFVLGPVLGGLLLPYGWRWLFLVNLPIVIVVVIAALRVLPARRSRVEAPFDWAGATVLGVTLAALAWGLGRAAESVSGLELARTWPAGLALAGLPLLLRIERRARDPIVPPELLASSQLRLVAAIAIATGLVEAAMVFLPSMAVAAFAVDAGRASYMMLPLVVSLIIGAPLAGRALDRAGPRPVIRVGLVLTTTGLLLFALVPLTTASFYVAGGLTGLGLSALLGAPLRYVVLEESGHARRGAGQGLLTLCLSTGRIAGAAVIGGVAAGVAAPLAGHRAALLGLGLVCSIAFVLSLRLRAAPAPQRRESAHGT